jgi:hypothetical protein
MTSGDSPKRKNNQKSFISAGLQSDSPEDQQRIKGEVATVLLLYFFEENIWWIHSGSVLVSTVSSSLGNGTRLAVILQSTVRRSKA